MDDVDLGFTGGVVGVDVIPHVHAVDIAGEAACAASVFLDVRFGDPFDREGGDSELLIVVVYCFPSCGLVEADLVFHSEGLVSGI